MKICRHHTAVDVIDLDDRTGNWIAVWDFFAAVKRAIEELKLIAGAALATSSATGADAPLLAGTGTPCPRAGMWVVVDRIRFRRQLDPGDAMPDVEGACGRWVWVGEAP